MTEPAPFLVQLDLDSGNPLHLQLYRQLREAILSGRLAPGDRLPATRRFAEDLGVSRTTVLTAVRRLMVEGFLDARVGSGTWVSDRIRRELLGGHLTAGEPEPDGAGGPVRLSRRGRSLANLLGATPAAIEESRPFQVGIPALDAFPWSRWARAVRKQLRREEHALRTYGSSLGYEPLRRALAAYLRHSRGVVCEPDQVLVLSGSQVGLALIAQVLLDAGDRAWVEDPGYPGAWGAFVAANVDARPVPVDEEGLDPAVGERAAAGASVAYVTPSHQFPLGVTMSLPRRLALLDWARRREAWVVEDDYDAEHRYGGQPLLSLQGLDRGRHVLYLGTFSKTLFPALRLGFLVLPAGLVEAFANARSFLDQHPPTIHQAALADFIEEGHYARHIRRMRDVYAARRDALLAALERELGPLLEVVPSESGLHVTAWLADDVGDRAVAAEARKRGLEVLPLSSCARQSARPGLVLGFGATPESTLAEAVPLLATAVERARARRGAA